MSKYRIVIPVVAQVEDFKNLLKQIPDKKLLTIVNNFDDPEVAILCKQAVLDGAEVVYWPDNRGCAASWNVGLKIVDSKGLDFVIICSPSCVWANNVNDFVKAIEDSENEEKRHMYIARGQHDTDTHAFAITRLGLKTIGLFDENIHPVYMEDSDWYRRMRIAGIDWTYIDGLRSSKALGGGVRNERVFLQYQRSAEFIKAYYEKKWGGSPGREKWTHPFDNPKLSIKDWPKVDHIGQVKPLSRKEYEERKDAGLV